MVKTKTENTWKFQTMGAAGMDAALQWSEDVGQHSKELFLLDEENLVVVNMKEASRYSFTPTKQSHQFTIFFGNDVKEKITPTSIKILPPYPNPQKKNEAISFTISSPDRSADTQAEITLYTSNGTTALKQSRSIKLGINQLVIEPDHNLSSGMYLYRIQISNGTLQQTATGKIIIL